MHMKRAMVLGLLVAVGSVAMVTAERAQQPAANAPRVVDVEKINDSLYVLRGQGGGGNTAVLIMANGVAVVDAKNPGWGAPILAKIKELTPKPVTMLINTHTHGDHVSGNVELPASVDFIAHENAKVSMEQMPIFKESKGVGLPKRTFKDKMTIGKGSDQIDLYYFGRGHTNGDAFVSFPAHRVVHAGDIFANKGVPLIDSNNGGSMLQIPDTLKKAHAGIPNMTTIINGHTPAQTTWADLKEYADFNADLVAYGRAGLKAGKTPEQLAAEWKLPEKYKGYSATASTMMGGLAGRFATLQKEIQ
jgi:glyoxylase-like metal-dependent hydrolase (beta-lactamase superfamily II)